MSLLPFAIIAITTALVFYSIGVWSEHLAQRLRFWHLLFFGGGLLCDITGTEMMRMLAGGSIRMDLHGLTGVAALVLMAVHAVWAAVVLLRNRPREVEGFHRFSLAVWIFWLIPYGTGMVLNSRLS